MQSIKTSIARNIKIALSISRLSQIQRQWQRVIRHLIFNEDLVAPLVVLVSVAFLFLVIFYKHNVAKLNLLLQSLYSQISLSHQQTLLQ
jgi:hypothetical protein